MDKSFQKHETSSDGKNVVEVKNLIDDLKAQREALRDQVKDINREIKSTQTYIRNEF
jgi:cell division septum initiation protein DivIVA